MFEVASEPEPQRSRARQLAALPAAVGALVGLAAWANGAGEDGAVIAGPALDPGSLAILGALGLGFLFIAMIVVANIAARRRRRRLDLLERARSAQVLSAALQHMSNGLILLDTETRIVACNDRVRALFDLQAADLAVGMTLANFIGNVGLRHGWEAGRVDRVLRNHALWMAHSDVTRIEQNMEDGRILDIYCRPIAAGGAVMTYDDVTEERRLQARLEEMAYTDALTGLCNRRHFNDSVVGSGNAAQHRQALMLDLDRFKPINDMFGHALGDAVLVETARRLRRVCRDGDLVFRLGGDEFAVLPVPSVTEGLEEFSARILAALNEPFRLGGHVLNVGCSVGIVGATEATDLEMLMKMADLALYRAKQNGRDQTVTYATGMMEEARQRQRTELDLKMALGKGEFELHYQPIHALPSRRLMGFEALIRWRHPERGMIPPVEFIPLAEESGLIAEIGDWVLDTAVRQMARWPAEIHMAVNVSPAQICGADLAGRLGRRLAEAGVAAGRLELELTETAMVQDADQIAEALHDLRRLGVRIAMDDFGTGYSSLTHLLAFEMDRIKIDRSFVDAATGDHRARAVLRAVIAMAQDMSVETIGEGVETEAQLSGLIALGCSAAQGYFFGKAMPADEASLLIHREAFALDTRRERDEAVLGGAAVEGAAVAEPTALSRR